MRLMTSFAPPMMPPHAYYPGPPQMPIWGTYEAALRQATMGPQMAPCHLLDTPYGRPPSSQPSRPVTAASMPGKGDPPRAYKDPHRAQKGGGKFDWKGQPVNTSAEDEAAFRLRDILREGPRPTNFLASDRYKCLAPGCGRPSNPCFDAAIRCKQTDPHQFKGYCCGSCWVH
jgi:hypothetical protein